MPYVGVYHCYKCRQLAEDHSSCESDHEDMVENSSKHHDGELLDVEDLGNVIAVAKKAKVCVIIIIIIFVKKDGCISLQHVVLLILGML